MFKIGIIGAENSHAMAFADLIHETDEAGQRVYPDAELWGTYGKDPADAEKIAAKYEGVRVVRAIEEFVGEVDAIMITSRKGSEHLDAARPFLKLGLPLFVDKPITASPETTREFVNLVEASGSKVCGGSALHYADDVLWLKAKREALEAEGSFFGGHLGYHADPESEHNGLYFYAPHLIKMATTIFGRAITALRATEDELGVTVLFYYDHFTISARYCKEFAMPSAVVHGKKESYFRNVDLSQIFRLEFRNFMGMLRGDVPPADLTELTEDVFVIDAIERSLKTGETVHIDKLR